MRFISDLPIGTLLIFAILLGTAFWRYRSGKRQFTLRGMLIAMFLVSLPLGWFAYGSREYLREQEVIAKLRAAQIDVRTDNFERPWPTFFFGDRWQRRAFAVYAESAKVTRRELELIGQLHELSTLSIGQGDFSDDDLASLANLPRLRELTLRRCPIDGSGLKHIPAEIPLERLSLSFSPIDDVSLKHVARWKSLEHLELSATQITDTGLNCLAGLENLDRLTLDHTAVTDLGIRRLVKMIAKVPDLSLQNTEVTQATLDGLKQGPFWAPAPSATHRRAATELLLQGIDVTVWNHTEPHCRVTFHGNGKKDPKTADLLAQLFALHSVALQSGHPNDSVIPLLTNLDDLREIIIVGPSLSEEALLELCRQKHPHLRRIEIDGCPFNSKTLSELAVFPSVEELYLSNMAIDNQAISRFNGFLRLRFLSFRNSRVSDEVAHKLKSVLPYTRITVNGQVIERPNVPGK